MPHLSAGKQQAAAQLWLLPAPCASQAPGNRTEEFVQPTARSSVHQGQQAVAVHVGGQDAGLHGCAGLHLTPVPALVSCCCLRSGVERPASCQLLARSLHRAGQHTTASVSQIKQNSTRNLCQAGQGASTCRTLAIGGAITCSPAQMCSVGSERCTCAGVMFTLAPYVCSRTSNLLQCINARGLWAAGLQGSGSRLN